MKKDAIKLAEGKDIWENVKGGMKRENNYNILYEKKFKEKKKIVLPHSGRLKLMPPSPFLGCLSNDY